ncbi:MAG: hypothetical protein R3Y26_02170 [Rikenellaceae bacterium]
MKENYVTSKIEVIEIEIEDAVLSASTNNMSITSVRDGGSAW